MTRSLLINFASKLDWRKNVGRHPGIFGNLFLQKCQKRQRYTLKALFKLYCGGGGGGYRGLMLLFSVPMFLLGSSHLYILFWWQNSNTILQSCSLIVPFSTLSQMQYFIAVPHFLISQFLHPFLIKFLPSDFPNNI